MFNLLATNWQNVLAAATKSAEKLRLPVCAVVGPTAVGKSELAIEIAKQFDGEIVNCDSRQLYRHLEIGTAKPSAKMRQIVPHHLYDVCEPGASFDAAAYAALARQTVAQIHFRHRLPILVGGTGFYLQAVLYGLCDTGAIDQGILEQLQAVHHEQGLASLYSELQKCDAETAARLHANDQQRIIRALAVFRSCGTKLSEIQRRHQSRRRQRQLYQPYIVGLHRQRATLYQHIDRRVAQMFADGILQEVHHFPAGRELGIGYNEARQVSLGELTVEQAVATVARQTRNYAKRQLTWFRRQSDIMWFDLASSAKIEDVLNSLRIKLAKHQIGLRKKAVL